MTCTSDEWPAALKPDDCGSVEPPNELYLVGKDIPPKEKCLGIVGTRRPTGAGREIAAEFARRFVEAGFAVVSGLAIGIDAIAHAAALSGGGHTIAVLGCGVDRVYPKENAVLRGKVETHGTLVSEYPPGTDSRPFHFPARNRIIASLCTGVVVVEGGERSGALITARYALDANRSVWAIPGSIRNPMASGPNQLIRESHAALVTSADHVFKEIAPSLVWSDPRVEGAPPVTGGEQAILFEMDDAPTPLGRMVSNLGQSTGELALTLARLEARGLIIKRRGGYEMTSAGVRVRSNL
jgi:DNA processing protein